MQFFDSYWYPMMLVGRTGREVPKELSKGDSLIVKTEKASSEIIKTVKAPSEIVKTVKVKSTVIP